MVLKNLIKKYKLDALFISDLNTIKYLYGFTGSNAYIIYSVDRVYFITDARYKTQAKIQTKLNYIYIYSFDLFKTIESILIKHKIKNLGFFPDKTNFSFYTKLNKLNIKLSSVDFVLSKLRMIKKKTEINNIKKAVQIQEAAFYKTMPFLLEEKNITEYTLARQLEANILLSGSEKISFDTIVAFNKNSALPHHQSSDTKISGNGFLIIDFGCQYKGYQSDQTVTFCFGKIKNELLKIYDLVYKARELAFKMIKPGLNLKILQQKIDDFFIKNNLKKYIKHSLGHGIGLEIHEEPMGWKYQDIILEENMVFSIEPGIYIPKLGGLRLEDLVKVSSRGCDLLTNLPKEKKIIL